jgi:Holliday junction DNA helicase RuvB
MPFTMPEGFADGDYPTSWTGFIGQQRAKDQIRLAAQSAKARKQPMDHILIASGTPGIGKTSLGLLAARTMGRKVIVVTGPVPATRAYGLLAKLDDRDVLFIDEAHKLVEGGKKHAEWLLHYLQDGVLLGAPACRDEYPYSRYTPVAPRVTVIAATTEPGRLPTTLTGRFPVRPTLNDYTPDEGAKITAQLARKVMAGLPPPTTNNNHAIAQAANSNPRAIRQILVTTRDMTVTGRLAHRPRTGYDIPAVLDWHGITPDGLDHTAQEYLKALARDFDGKAGQKAIEDRLQEPGGLADTERVLLDQHLITKTNTGRAITMAGAIRAREIA